MRPIYAVAVALTLAFWAAAGPQDPPPLLPVPSAADVPKPAAQQFKELIPGLVDALKDTDAEVRQNSALALAALGRDALVPLKEALKDANREKRAAAAYALGQMGVSGREAMAELLKVLKDDEAAVRRSASQAINRIVTAEGNVQAYGGTRGLFGPPVIQVAPSLPAPGPIAPGKN